MTQVDEDRATDHGPLRVGICGPVGSGKTALMEALCTVFRDRYDICAITNDIYTKEDALLRQRARAHQDQRILLGVDVVGDGALVGDGFGGRDLVIRKRLLRGGRCDEHRIGVSRLEGGIAGGVVAVLRADDDVLDRLVGELLDLGDHLLDRAHIPLPVGDEHAVLGHDDQAVGRHEARRIGRPGFFVAVDAGRERFHLRIVFGAQSARREIAGFDLALRKNRSHCNEERHKQPNTDTGTDHHEKHFLAISAA
jgi:hypothetical protein